MACSETSQSDLSGEPIERASDLAPIEAIASSGDEEVREFLNKGSVALARVVGDYFLG